ncbi:MAG: hypothetical protein PUE98_09620 [Galactobacillus timonensis]|uniref:hypothetical protein n=1 Tax=Galactobacillus timonensis TaxID=2041840 RepID=UPI00240A098D|nr:hypothetical protein [Galactobacillus timonensis]MDD6600704.1 hypothetical protein [Galactobacillus timonensis]
MRHTLKRAFVLFLAFSTLGGTVHAEETPASPSPADTTPSAEPSYSENSAGKTTPSESQQPSKSLEVSSESSSSPVTSTSESDITPSLTENRAPAADPVTTVVAKIGETPYYTLKDAVDAAKDGDKVDVLADIVLGKDEMADGALYDASKYAYILFDKAGTVTIDFHEHRLEIPQQYSYDPADDSPYFAYPAMIHYIVFFINSGKLVINNGSFIGPNNFDENDPRFNGVASKQTIPSIVMAEGGQQQDRSLEFNRMQFDNWVIESGENYESYTQKATITANHSVFNQCNFGYPQISFIDSPYCVKNFLA